MIRTDLIQSLLKGIDNVSSSLPIPKILKIALKELKIIRNQRIAIAIILLYPLVVIGSLGIAFSGENTLKNIDVPIYLHSEYGNLDINSFAKDLEDAGYIKVRFVNSSDEIISWISEKKAKVGLEVFGRKTKYENIMITAIYDNSDVVTSEFFLGITRRTIEEAGMKKTREIITDMWKDFGKIKSDLNEEVGKIENYIKDFGEAEERLVDLNKNISKIDINEIKSILLARKGDIGKVNEKINSFEKDINSFEAASRKMAAKLSSTRQSVEEYSVQIDNAQRNLEETKLRLEEAAQSPFAELIAPIIADIDESLLSLNTMKQQISNTNNILAEADHEISSMSSKIENSKKSISEIKGSMGGAYSDLNKVEVQIKNMEDAIAELNDLINDSVDYKKTVVKDLNSAKEKTTSFLKTLDDVGKYSPDTISQPILFSTTPLFTSERLSLMTPFAITFMLMITAILMTSVGFVSEINEGAYLRQIISSSGKLVLFSGKIIGQIIFAFVEALIILAIALLFFNIEVNLDIFSITIAILAIAFGFIGIGIFLINFSQKQTTVILSSMLVMLPMVFLSGIVLPIDLVNPAVQIVAKNLPLSVSMEVLTDIMIKKKSIEMLIPRLMQLIVPSLILIIVTMKNEKIK